MDFPDNRGIARKIMGDENRRKVEEYYRKHPNALRRECAEAVGVSEATVRNHIRAIKAEQGAA